MQRHLETAVAVNTPYYRSGVPFFTPTAAGKPKPRPKPPERYNCSVRCIDILSGPHLVLADPVTMIASPFVAYAADG